jgi:outer membrane lipoprotein-sorting protein
MKMLKTLTIIFGIVIGIVGFISTTVKADGKSKLNKTAKAEKAKVTMKVYDAEMQETEHLLIENYLQMVEYENVDTSIIIVNEAGLTIYKGTKEDATDLLKKSDYLFSFGEAEHYLITE